MSRKLKYFGRQILPYLVVGGGASYGMFWLVSATGSMGLWVHGWSAQMITQDVAMMVLLAFVAVTALSQVILATLRIFTPNFLKTS